MSRRRLLPLALVALAAVSFAASAARGQVPDDLAQPKNFRALRIASTDPKLKNGDFRPIKPGATLELGRIEGHGQITHMWFTINGKSADHLRELVLRIYWDGAEKPAVECPLGEFFGLGFGRYVEYKSAPIAIGGIKALNCYWPMPFEKSARLTMTNEGSEPVPNCYFNIDYRLDGDARERTAPHVADFRWFHTQYRQAYPVPKGEDYLLCETTGAGHYVGTFLSVMANSDGWWGEGNDKFYIDSRGGVSPRRQADSAVSPKRPDDSRGGVSPRRPDDGTFSTPFGLSGGAVPTSRSDGSESRPTDSEKPTIEGTGSEDYFCGAWDFQHAFWNPYNGVPLYDNPDKGGEKRGILNTCYRWHLLDPVPFQKSLRLTIEHGRHGPNDDREPLRNHYSSISYFYVDHSEGDAPTLPPLAERIPKLLPLPGAK